MHGRILETRDTKTKNTLLGVEIICKLTYI